MTPESPITAHNRPLAFEVITRTSTFSRYPRVSEQLECLPLETQKLFTNGYNPSINTKGWLAYRFHKGGASTKLAIAQLGDGGVVLRNGELVTTGGDLGEDDPKLFSFRGDDYISWVESVWLKTGVPTGCTVKFAKFNDMQLGEIRQTPIGRNDGSAWEKNWVYFSHRDHLYVIYECHPTHRIYRVGDAQGIRQKQYIEELASDGVNWPYGGAKGGTVPIAYEGKLLRFFHSRLDNEYAGVAWRYYIGAYLMNPEPPFEIVRVSKRPVLFGSEMSDLKIKDRPNHWKANVVFCSGAVEKDGAFMLSVGENDSASLLVKVTEKDLNF
jgi:hypothetical protein